MSQGFNDLGRRQPDVESRVEVDFKLRFAAAERSQDAERDQLPLLRLQAGSGVDVTEAVRDQMVGEVGCDVASAARICSLALASSAVSAARPRS